MKSFSWLFMRLRALRERENKLHNPKEDHRKENGRHGKQSTDHTGRVFPSFKAMCAAWGVSPGTVRVRICQLGWSHLAVNLRWAAPKANCNNAQSDEQSYTRWLIQHLRQKQKKE